MLGQDIASYVAERHAAIIRRFFPDWQLPGFFAGFPTQRHDVSDFLYNLAHLHQLGYREIAGTPIERAMVTMLKQVHAPSTRTFWSYRIAEGLLAWGPWKDNPLLAELTPAERDNIAAAIDSTSIYDPAEKKLRNLPNNYWGVLSRCEYARYRLGVLDNTELLDLAVKKAEEALFASGSGHFDDDVNFGGRYDIYSPDMLLFLEPLWDRFDQAKLRKNLVAAAQLVEKAALENGACIAWGRSIGALSLCLTMEANASAIKLGLATDPARSLGLIGHAFEQFKGWITDDLISAHRYRNTFWYRGPQRLLGMTLDCLGKLLYTAKCLTPPAGEGVPDHPVKDATKLFPPIDELIRFDDQGAGVWLFRNNKISFQLPIIAYATADYVPWLRSPGLFENPVDSDKIVGLPRLIINGEQYSVSGRAAAIEKSPNALVLRYDKLNTVTHNKPAGPPVPARVEIRYRVEGDAVHGQIALDLDRPPEAATFDIAEARRPLSVNITGGDRVSVVDVEGIPPFRSFWGELRRWHQTHIAPSRSIRLSFTVRPAVRVTHAPADHDYNRSLFDAMPAGAVVERWRPNATCIRGLNVGQYLDDSDILHIGWPEHMFAPHGLSDEDFDKRLADFIEQVRRSGKKVVWTMHNRIPHFWPHERGRKLYRLWASVADGVIHHSRCGMELMRRELPYKPTARHVVIPHGHFGAIMPKLDRAALEKKFGLQPCAMRFGLLGRPQKEKQFDLVIRAFLAADRPDQQLVLTAGPNDPVIQHPRIKVLIREGFLSRAQINEHTQLVDVQVCGHTGETYLTSGMPADAIAVGQAMFVPDWAYFREHLSDAAVYHDNTEATLTKLFRDFTVEQMEAKKAAMLALQDQYAWPRLAQMTLDLYRSL